ncbi:MAG: 5'/3'-nucleotidase SurE, partial [Pseudomonadota bacterium]
FSQAEKGWAHLYAAAAAARASVEQVLATAPRGAAPWLLNFKLPNRPDAASLPRVLTRLGRRHASEPVIRQVNPRGEPIYWIGPAGDAREAGAGTDVHAVANGRMSIPPLQVDLTDHAARPGWAARLGLPSE